MTRNSLIQISFIWLIIMQVSSTLFGQYNFNQKIVASTRGAQAEFAKTVDLSGNFAVVGAPQENGERGAAYIFERNTSTNTWQEVAKLTAPDAMPQDHFGHSVSIDANTGVVIIGAPLDDHSSMSDAGSAYIYELNGTWSYVNKVIAPVVNNGDHFGWSVSISNDMALIGSPKYDGQSTGFVDAGTAYLFERNSTYNLWLFYQQLHMPDSNVNDEYGYSVALDAYTNRAVIGAWLEDNATLGGSSPMSEAGSVYVFHENSGNWFNYAKVTPSDRQAGDHFGAAVSISPNTTQILVGAPLHDYDQNLASFDQEAGAVYLFTPIQIGQYGNQVKITPSDREESDQFGSSVDLEEKRIIVGAPNQDYEDVNQLNFEFEAGAAYVFDEVTSNQWTLAEKITPAPDRARESQDFFGNSVSITSSHVIVGAYFEDHNENDDLLSTLNEAGSAYIYQTPCNSISINLTSTDASCFGVNDGAISMTFNANGNPAPYLINWSNGAQTQNLNNIVSGTYTVTILAANGCSATASTTVNDQSGLGQQLSFNQLIKRHARVSDFNSADFRVSDDQFGEAVDIDGDFAVVGVNSLPNGLGSGSPGNVFVFQRTGGTWQQIQRISDPNGTTDDQFGSAVAISGNTIVVGAPGANSGPSISGAGRVYVFDMTTWTLQATLVEPGLETSTDNHFGEAVDISGNLIAVAAPGQKYILSPTGTPGNYLAQAGAVHVYDMNQSYNRIARLHAQRVQVSTNTIVADRFSNDEFGRSLSIDGNTVVVGCQHQDRDEIGGNSIYDAGAAYVYAIDDVNNTSAFQAKLTAPTAERDMEDEFGQSVSISGTRIAVGVLREDLNGLTNTGGVYVFTRTNNGWINNATDVIPSTVASGDIIGIDVSLSGRYLAVGASGVDDPVSGTNSGAVYVFLQDNSGSWNQINTLTENAGNLSAGDYFGESVAMDGASIIIGAPQDNDDETNTSGNTVYEAGSVYFVDGVCDCAPYSVETALSAPICPNASNGVVSVSSVNGGIAPYTYEWFDANSVSMGTGQTLGGLTVGTYTVVVTDANGCTATANSGIGQMFCQKGMAVAPNDNGQAGLNEQVLSNAVFDADATIQLFPNPTNGRFSVLVPNTGNFEIRVTDISGKLIQMAEYANTDRVELTIEQPAGLYFVRVVSANFDKTIKVIRQ